MNMFAIRKYFTEELDSIAAISGLFFGILITSLYLISKTIHLLTLGLALTFASLMYLALKNRENISNVIISKSIKNLFECLFFIFFSASLLVMHAGQDRPVLYFVLISVSIGFLALSILYVRTKIDIIFQVIKILIISINLKYSIFLSYWGIGSDYWAHLAMNNNLATNAFIEVLSGKESSYPLMHIQTAVNQIVTNTPIKEATNFAIIIPLVISALCVFLVARKFFDPKMGLLAMLIISITDFHTHWGSTPQTTTFGFCLYCFLMFLIFQTAITEHNKIIWFSITILFIPLLILTHAVSSFIALISIFGLIIGSYIYKAYFNKYTVVVPSMIIFIIYGIGLLSYWFFALYNNKTGEKFFDVIVSTLKTNLANYAGFLNRPEAISEYTTTLAPLFERLADVAGLTILIFLSALGCMFWLSKKYRNVFTFSMISCILLLLVITFGFPLFGMRNIMPNRWFVFIYFFLSIMAAFALLTMTSKIPNKGLKVIVCFILLSSLAFFMVTNTISNEDSPLWLEETTISTSYSIQEGIGAKTISTCSEKILVDSRYIEVINNIPNNVETVKFRSDQQINSTHESVFIWRRYMLNRPIQLYTHLDGYYKDIECPTILGDKLLNRLDNYDKIYDNCGVQGYYLT